MFNHKRLDKRITELQLQMRDIDRSYRILLDERARTLKEIRDRFDSELAQYRSTAQATQTDRIKFGVLEEWMRDVFELNNLKFSDKDFIEKSEEDALREKIIGELNSSVKSAGVNTEELADILVKVIRK